MQTPRAPRYQIEAEDDDEYSGEGGWINWYCGLKGHESIAEIEEEFLKDNFNLCGLRSRVQSPALWTLKRCMIMCDTFVLSTDCIRHSFTVGRVSLWGRSLRLFRYYWYASAPGSFSGCAGNSTTDYAQSGG